jgi:L-malate glycosyltransferase
MRAIHQLVAGFNNGDAISNEARALRGVFRGWGADSEIFCESRRILPQLRREILDISDCAARVKPDDVVMLHLSIGSLVNDAFASLRCRKVIRYHNITPAVFFQAVNQQTARVLKKGREQARELAGAANLNLAVSRFNASELTGLGYGDVRVLPLLLDLNALRSRPDEATLRRFDDGRTNVLFVGRCVPNKRIEDALQAFYFYQRYLNPNSRFIQAGSHAGTERYYYLLLTLVKELGIQNCHFAGAVTQPQLNALYGCSRIFLCMSEHEGFCIPLIESMVHDLPVVARAAAAVPETMDGAGVLVHEPKYEMIAELMGRLETDATLRAAVVRGQQDRLTRYCSRNLEQEWRQHLAPLLA